jgi:hypothetical protein
MRILSYFVHFLHIIFIMRLNIVVLLIGMGIFVFKIYHYILVVVYVFAKLTFFSFI